MANSVENCDQHLAIQVEKNLDINAITIAFRCLVPEDNEPVSEKEK